MIARYSRKELKNIWSEENKYKIWLDVEIAAAQAMEKLGQIPKGVSSIVRKKAKINVKRIHQIENQVKHDVIAFLTSITEKVGAEGKFMHKGMTSSDILDTCFNIQLVQSGKILRLRGKGIPSINGYGSGDLLVHVNVWTPKTLDKKQKQFFESMTNNEHFEPKPESSEKSFFDRVKDMFS